MNKLTKFIFLTMICLLLLAFGSCQDYKTYAQQLEEMEEYIEDFMKQHDYVITETQPDSIPWLDEKGRRMFYETETGVYMHVIDTGKSAGNVKKGQVVMVRYTEMSVKGDSVTYSNLNGSFDPVEICYGTVNTGGNYSYYWGDCPAWHEALTYVGDYGHVMLIAPTDQGMPIYNNSQVELLSHFYELKFTFWK